MLWRLSEHRRRACSISGPAALPDRKPDRKYECWDCSLTDGNQAAPREFYLIRETSRFRWFSCAAITRVISISIALAVTGLAT
jgi:hypothetical protein